MKGKGALVDIKGKSKGDLGELKGKSKGDLGELKGKSKGDLGAVKGETKGDLGELKGKSKAKGDLGAVKGESKGGLDLNTKGKSKADLNIEAKGKGQVGGILAKPDLQGKGKDVEGHKVDGKKPAGIERRISFSEAAEPAAPKRLAATFEATPQKRTKLLEEGRMSRMAPTNIYIL